MSEKLRRFTKAVYGFDAVVKRVPAHAWDNPSPCPGWAARDVVGHQVQIMGLVAAAATGTEPPYTGTPAEAAGEDPGAAWAAARDGVLEALDHQGALQTEADTPFGRMPIDRFIGMLAVDPLAHTWDLATAAGVDPALDPELALIGVKQLTRAGDLVRGPGMYEPAVPIDDDAPIQAQFVAITGRDPG